MRIRRLCLGALALSLAASSALACSAKPVESDEDADEGALLTQVMQRFAFTGHFTNWHRRDINLFGYQLSLEQAKERTTAAKYVGLVKLAALREGFFDRNLIDTNPDASHVDVFDVDPVTGAATSKRAIHCEGRTRFRTADGTCNAPENPGMGAARSRFGRNAAGTCEGVRSVEANELAKFDHQKIYADCRLPETGAKLMSPNPRTVSRVFLTRPTENGKPKMRLATWDGKTRSRLNLLAASWLQFTIHDWLSHGPLRKTGDVLSIPLEAGDPLRAENGSNVMVVPKTRSKIVGDDKAFYNDVTQWWDGSQLYGSDEATAASLRKQVGGVRKAELDLDEDGFLPADGESERTGQTENWWLGLSLLHTTFAREHNAIVTMLRGKHPEMNEDELYGTARLVNAAVMAKIHTVEWSHAANGNPSIGLGLRGNWSGILNPANDVDSEIDKASRLVGQLPLIGTVFKEPGHVLFGIVGNPRDLGKKNIPFAFTEEFISAYRFHQVLPEELALTTRDGRSSLPLAGTRGKDAYRLVHQHGMETLIGSFAATDAGAQTINNFPSFLQNLDLSNVGLGKYDVGAAEILRDRERGVPRYNELRRQVGLPALSSIDEITHDPDVRAKLKQVYGDDIEAVDASVGALAEDRRPAGLFYPETQFQIFLGMSARRLLTDRFYTDDFRPAIYTQEGIDWVNQASMKTVLLRHFPGLAESLAHVENAFLPWDGSYGANLPFDYARGSYTPDPAFQDLPGRTPVADLLEAPTHD